MEKKNKKPVYLSEEIGRSAFNISAPPVYRDIKTYGPFKWFISVCQHAIFFGEVGFLFFCLGYIMWDQRFFWMPEWLYYHFPMK